MLKITLKVSLGLLNPNNGFVVGWRTEGGDEGCGRVGLGRKDVGKEHQR